jgi:hypothetical protein
MLTQLDPSVSDVVLTLLEGHLFPDVLGLVSDGCHMGSVGSLCGFWRDLALMKPDEFLMHYRIKLVGSEGSK